MIRPGTRTLIALDLLRFACALMVAVFHYGAGLPLLPPPGAATLLTGMAVDHSWIPFVDTGWIGVELFFVVSGFVIAWSAEGSSAAGFLGRRALRLLPAAWLCCSLTAVVLLACSTLPAAVVGGHWLGSMAFWPTGTPIDPSYWTLAIEVNFYLLVALVLRGGSGLDRIEQLGVALGCASLTYWIASCIIQTAPADNRYVQLTLLPHGCFFALGILLRVRQRTGTTAVRTAFLLLFTVAAALEIAEHRREVCPDYPAYIPALLLFALGMLPIVFAERLQPWLERRIPVSLAVTLGLITYPLYLLHHEIGAMTAATILRRGGSFLPAVAAALAVSLGLAWIVVRFGEPRLRAGLRRLGRRPSAGAVPLGQVSV